MKFDYKEFHIDAPPLDEGDHYHAKPRSTGARRGGR
jgi:hypothetical protein